MGTLVNLLVNFLQIGLFSIGGGYATIPLIQEAVVNTQNWLSFQEFTDIITISQMTPGPIAVNTSTFVGIRIAGIPGALVATFGCVISGFVISILLFCIFEKYKNTNGVMSVLGGLRAVSVGLIAASAGTILLIALCGTSDLFSGAAQINAAALVLFGAALFILRKFKWNPMLVMVLCGAAGVVIYGLCGL